MNTFMKLEMATDAEPKVTLITNYKVDGFAMSVLIWYGSSGSNICIGNR